MKHVHGHEVLKMMLSSGQTYSKASLTDQIILNFGTDARFFTCSADNLTAAELVDFLEAKGKLVPMAGGLGTSETLVCAH